MEYPHVDLCYQAYWMQMTAIRLKRDNSFMGPKFRINSGLIFHQVKEIVSLDALRFHACDSCWWKTNMISRPSCGIRSKKRDTRWTRRRTARPPSAWLLKQLTTYW